MNGLRSDEREEFTISLGRGHMLTTVLVLAILGAVLVVGTGLVGRAVLAEPAEPARAGGIGGAAMVVAAVLVVALSWMLAPRGYEISDEGVVVLRNVGAARVPWERVASVERVAMPLGRLMQGVRLFGVGGLFGSFGWFWQRDLGLFRAYLTRTDRLVRVGLHTGHAIVLSPDDPERFVAACRSRLKA